MICIIQKHAKEFADAKGLHMGLVNIPGYIHYPIHYFWHGYSTQQGPFSTALQISNSGEKIAFMTRIPKDGTLHKVGFMCGAVSNAQTLKVSFQNVDATTGTPDGTADQYRTITPVANTWLTTGILSSDGTDNGTKRTVVKNEWMAVVFEFDSTVGNVIINGTNGTLGRDTPGAYTKRYASSAWAVQNNAHPNMLLEYSDGSYGTAYWLSCINGTSNALIETDGTYDQAALRFKLPFACKIAGAMINVRLDGNCKLELLDASSTVLATAVGVDGTTSTDTWDKDVVGDLFYYRNTALFATPVQVTKDTVYRMSLRATTTSYYYYLSGSYPTNAALAQVDNIEMYGSYRMSSNAWTDATTARPNWSLIISEISDGNDPVSNISSGINY